MKAQWSNADLAQMQSRRLAFLDGDSDRIRDGMASGRRAGKEEYTLYVSTDRLGQEDTPMIYSKARPGSTSDKRNRRFIACGDSCRHAARRVPHCGASRSGGMGDIFVQRTNPTRCLAILPPERLR